METNSTEEEEDRAASAVQGLLKVFRARKAYAKLAQEKREENKRINVEAPFVPTPSAAVDAFCKDFLRKQDFVLDLGCGDGRVLIQASAKVEFAVGVDIQPAPLQRAIEASSSVRNVQWILGDFHDAKVIALLPKVTVVFGATRAVWNEDMLLYLLSTFCLVETHENCAHRFVGELQCVYVVGIYRYGIGQAKCFRFVAHARARGTTNHKQTKMSVWRELARGEVLALNLGFQRFDEKEFALLKNAIGYSDCELTSLNLYNAKANVSLLTDLFKVLTWKSSKLRVLDLSRIRLTPQLVCALSRALQHKNCKLQDLRVAWCGIDDSGMTVLSEALASEHCQLRTLDIYGNGFRSSVALCNAILHANCLLTELVWASNQLSSPSQAQLLTQTVSGLNTRTLLVILISPHCLARLQSTSLLTALPVELIRMLKQYL